MHREGDLSVTAMRFILLRVIRSLSVYFESVNSVFSQSDFLSCICQTENTSVE